MTAIRTRFPVALLLATFILAGCGGKEERMRSHLDKGRALFEKGEYDRAGVEVRNVLQIDPRSGEAYMLAARIWERQNDYQRAFASYVKATELSPDNLDAKARIGRFHLFGGDLARAKKVVDEILAAQPDHPAGRTLAAALAAAGGDASAATEQARAVLAAIPGEADASALLARLLVDNRDFRAGREVLEKAAERNPKNVDLLLALASIDARLNDPERTGERYRRAIELAPQRFDLRVTLASHLVRQSRLDEAEKVLREAVRADPSDDQRRLLVVELLSSAKGVEAAEKELLAAIAERPRGYDLRAGLATLYNLNRRADDAVKVLEKAVSDFRRGPEAARARVQLAAIHAQNGRGEQADRLIAEVLKENPRDNQALLLRAERLLAAKDASGAIVDLRSVLKDQPDSMPLLTLLARAHLSLGQPELAREVIQRAVQLYPARPQFRFMLASFLVSQGQREAALREVDEVLRARPDDLEALQVRAEIQAGGKDFAGAEKTLRRLVAATPQGSLGHFRLAQLYIAQNRTADAEKELEAGLAKQPQDLEALAGLARLYIVTRRVDRAVARLRAARMAAPDNAAIRVMLGETLASTGRLKEAEPEFRRAIELAPRLDVAHVNLARLRLAERDYAGARTAIVAGLKALPRNAVLEGLVAESWQMEGNYEKAIAQYEAMVRHTPGNDIAANNLASLLTDHRSDRASFERALALSLRFHDAQNPLLLDTLGWAHYRLGNYREAVEVLRIAASRTEAPVVHLHFGLALHKAGEVESARKHLRRALEANIAIPGVEEAKTLLARAG